MKKCLLAFLAICLAVMIAVPAMALDTKFSGQYRIRGFHNDNFGLQSSDSSDSYMDMRFRLQTDFIVSDHLTLTTRFDALDNKLLGRPDTGARERDNIDFDRAFMTINTDIGTFMGGRMSGGTWGTSFGDTEEERDRLRWHDTFGDLWVVAIYEKRNEQDIGNVVSDQDWDSYNLGFTYKLENMTAGMLYSFTNKRDIADRKDVNHLFQPFVIGQFGPFGFQGEFRYQGFGDAEFDDDRRDRDYEKMALNVEGTYSMDMFNFELGYIWVRAPKTAEQNELIERLDDPTFTDPDVTKVRSYNDAIGNDWQKVWILTNSEDINVASGLGGLGNFSQDGRLSGLVGAQLAYAGLSMAPMEDLNVKFLVAYARADKTTGDLNKNIGWEYDLFVDYKIFDNLTYSFIAAYLDTGKFWNDINDGRKDNLHLFHQLRLSF